MHAQYDNVTSLLLSTASSPLQPSPDRCSFLAVQLRRSCCVSGEIGQMSYMTVVRIEDACLMLVCTFSGERRLPIWTTVMDARLAPGSA